MNLSNRKRRKLAGKATAVIHAMEAFRAELQAKPPQSAPREDAGHPPPPFHAGQTVDATTTGEGAGVRVPEPPRFEKGDRVLIPAVVVTTDPDFEGDIVVALSRRGAEANAADPRSQTYAAASALRPAKGVGE